MKKLKRVTGLVLVLTLIYEVTIAQTRAVTELGDTIYVYDNGTWSFDVLDDAPEVADEFGYLNEELEIATIDEQFSYPSSAKKELKNRLEQFIIKYDDSEWKRVPPATLNEEAEFALQSKTTDIWCIVISEETEIPMEQLFKIAKNTMEQNIGGKPEVIKTEYRMVNGTKVLRGVLNASFSGISFIFDTYYFADSRGSLQFTTWTSDKLWEKNQKRIGDLLNGLIIAE